MKKINIGLFLICIVLFVVSIVSAVLGTNNSTLLGKSSTNVEKDWTANIQNETINVSFPYKFEYKKNRQIELKKDLRSLLRSNYDTVCLITDFSSFEVFLGNNAIYCYNNTDYDGYNNIAKRKVHIIKIPPYISNNELTIKLNMKENPTLTYGVNSVIIGDRLSIISSLIEKEIVIFIIILLSITLGIFATLVGFVAKIKNIENLKVLVNIGGFGIITGLYALSETNTFQIITTNTLLINNITFIMLMLIPVPILLLVQKEGVNKDNKLITGAETIAIVNFLVQFVLTTLKIRDYRSMLSYTHAVLIMCIILVLIMSLDNWRKRRKDEAFFIISIVPMVIGGIIDLIIYQFGFEIVIGMCFFAGVLIFGVLQIIDIISKYLKYYKLSVNSSLYQKMAFTDGLTLIGNRAAFEEKVTNVDNEIAKLKSVWCISIDLNNLKVVNDTKGHKYGDQLIVGLSNILKAVFENAGYCYRIGGDEFTVIIYNMNKDKIVNLINNLYMKTSEYNEKSNIKISFAIGYDQYNFKKDISFSETIVRADALMYENKREIKSKS